MRKKRAFSAPELRDALVRLTVDTSRGDYPELMRLIVAVVEVDGKETVMSFISNNVEWAPGSLCDLYKARWAIEVFFKQSKQTLQLADFLGHNEQAVRRQVWTALLTYLLLRFVAFRSKWTHQTSPLTATCAPYL